MNKDDANHVKTVRSGILDWLESVRYRHTDIVEAASRTCEVLMNEYRKEDGAFAFHGEHCLKNHHSIRLCETPQPISDMLGTTMCLNCLEYMDEWNDSYARFD